MKSILYHGTPNGNQILESNILLCNSFPEYTFEVSSKVLSLTRSIHFAKEYALTERDPPYNPMVFVLDRDVLRFNYKIYLARSPIWDLEAGYESREECEEFVIKPIPLDHPSMISYMQL